MVSRPVPGMAPRQPSHHVRWERPSPARDGLGTAGNEAWATGAWSETGQGQTGGPTQVGGYWSAIYIREGEDWKIRMLAYNVTPAPAAAPSPTATPSSQ